MHGESNRRELFEAFVSSRRAMKQADRRRPRASCDQIIRLAWEYLDDELDEEPRRQVWRHLRDCPPCRAYFHFERAFLRAVGDREGAASDTAALLRKVMDALRAEGYRGWNSLMRS